MKEEKPKKWTLKALAKKLDVSVATMSNAFKRPDQLSPQLRDYILKECLKLGYAGPSSVPGSLRSKQTGIVGVLLSNHLGYSFSDEVAHQFLEGIASVLEKDNLGMLIMSSRPTIEQTFYLESFVDKFIVYGPPKREIRDRLLKQSKPMVAVDFTLDGYASINIDNYKSAFNCAKHAMSQPSADVAVLGLGLFAANVVCRVSPDIVLKPKSITVQRLNGFVDAAAEKSISIPSERIWNIPDNTHKMAYQAAREALTSSPRPSLLLCMSDRIALSALKAARELELRVPEDVRITGFDDIPESSSQHPSLTTIHQKSREKGKLAAQMLVGIIPSSNMTLKTDLVIRQSCP